MRKTLALALTTGLLIGLVASAGAAPKPATVWEDPAGDVNNGGQLPASAPGGFDLVSGTINKVGKDQLEFVVTHADMPPTATPVEAFRLIWGLTVGTTQY